MSFRCFACTTVSISTVYEYCLWALSMSIVHWSKALNHLIWSSCAMFTVYIIKPNSTHKKSELHEKTFWNKKVLVFNFKNPILPATFGGPWESWNFQLKLPVATSSWNLHLKLSAETLYGLLNHRLSVLRHLPNPIQPNNLSFSIIPDLCQSLSSNLFLECGRTALNACDFALS